MNLVYKISVVCSFLFVTSNCHSLPKPNFSPPGKHLKVLTYNVNWGVAQPEKVINFIDKSNSDVVCLQETNQYWQQLLEPQFAKDYPYHLFFDSSSAGGLTIMSKYKFKSHKLIQPKFGWFPACLFELETPLGLVQFLNIHLHPSLSEKGEVTFRALATTPQTRFDEIQDFLGYANLAKPLVVVGDFNENEKGRAVQSLIKQGFTNALSLYDTSSKTWKWKVYGIPLSARYDHIVFSKHLKCSGARVSDVDASDHMPVEAVILAQDKAKSEE